MTTATFAPTIPGVTEQPYAVGSGGQIGTGVAEPQPFGVQLVVQELQNLQFLIQQQPILQELDQLHQQLQQVMQRHPLLQQLFQQVAWQTQQQLQLYPQIRQHPVAAELPVLVQALQQQPQIQQILQQDPQVKQIIDQHIQQLSQQGEHRDPQQSWTTQAEQGVRRLMSIPTATIGLVRQIGETLWRQTAPAKPTGSNTQPVHTNR